MPVSRYMDLPHRLPARWVVLAALLVSVLPVGARASDKKVAPAAHAAAQYPANDAHQNEHVTVAADPCDAPKDCDFFRLPYLQHGFLPVRVVFTNDSDRALSLDDVRIQFISANKDVIPAATLEDINRRLFSTRSAQGTKLPGPIPITIHHKPVDKKITEDDDDFGFQGTVVNAHETLAGYLFYDIRDLDDPPVKDSEIYVKEVKTLDGKHELFAFSIPLDKWLAAQPKAAAEKKTVKTDSPDDHAWHPDDDSKSK